MQPEPSPISEITFLRKSRFTEPPNGQTGLLRLAAQSASPHEAPRVAASAPAARGLVTGNGGDFLFSDGRADVNRPNATEQAPLWNLLWNPQRPVTKVTPFQQLAKWRRGESNPRPKAQTPVSPDAQESPSVRNPDAADSGSHQE